MQAYTYKKAFMILTAFSQFRQTYYTAVQRSRFWMSTNNLSANINS